MTPRSPALATEQEHSPACPPEVFDSAQRLFALADRLGWKGYDPHDLLLSPVFRPLPHISTFLARAVIQAGRRMGDLPRRLLGVRPHEEAKALSDFLSAAALLCRDGQDWACGYVRPLVDRLLAASVPTRHGQGWGLHFPYTSRFASVDTRSPNLYQTVNAVQALLDAHVLSDDRRLVDLALEGVRFIVEDLGYHQAGGLLWFRYWPGVDSRMVNVQALIAGALARLAGITGDAGLAALADRAAGTVVASQSPWGSWRYSEDGKANFVDGFHTGFVLQGLAEYETHRADEAVAAVREARRRGFAFFKQHLVSRDGAPLDFAGGRPTQDGQTVAQCIQTLAVCAEDEGDLRLAGRIWLRFRSSQSLRDALDTRPGWRMRWGPRYPALRWTLGPAALATAHLIHSARRPACSSASH